MSLVPYVHLDVPLAGLGAGTTVALPTGAAHHLTRVLRLGPGAMIEIADGDGWHTSAQLGDGTLALRVAAAHSPPPPPALVVAQALAKGRKLDEVVRQITELGADGFVALRTVRSVVSLDAARQAKVTGRWRQVAWAASEQARRPTRPDVTGPITVDALLDRGAGREGGALEADGDAMVLIAHPGGRALPAVLAERPRTSSVTIAIGPEGGFDDDEVARLEAGGARCVGLGPSVLRTEHAAAAAIAACAVLLGRWD